MADMIEKAYPFGQTVRLSASFTDGEYCNAEAVDPDAVTLKTKSPAAAVVTYTYGVGAEIIRDEAGEYHADLAFAVEGKWLYRWEGTGANAAIRDWRFTIGADAFA